MRLQQILLEGLIEDIAMAVNDDLTTDGYEVIPINTRAHSVRSSTGFWIMRYKDDRISISFGADDPVEVFYVATDFYERIISIIGPPYTRSKE